MEEPQFKNSVNTNTVGAIVRRFRTLRNMTQLELSKAMGHRTPEWAGMIEAGQRTIDLDRVPRLAEILNINVADLTKHCLFEYYPTAANALFEEEGDPTTIREDHSPQPIRLLPAAYSVARRFEDLPPAFQQVVLALLVALEGAASGGIRHREARGKPVASDTLPG